MQKLKDKGGSWCIVEEVNDSSCIVNTWNDQLEVPLSNLESTEFDTEQYQNIEDIGVRMTELHQTGKLDKAALWVLNGLAKLDKPYLTTLEALETFIEEFYRTEKSALFYANKLNISTKHLNRITKISLGKTTSNLISERVILEAKRLLIHSKNSLSSVAETLGYEDYAYFSRVFKQKTKSTPQGFKKQF